MRTVDTPVLIVGAGPVGLMSALLLARQGVRCRIIERRPGPQRAPAAHVVNARTLEICRAAGVDMDALAAVSKPPHDAGFVRWVTTLSGPELGCLPYERQLDEVLEVTPTPLRNLSQHRFEPILVETLARAGVEVAWGHTWQQATSDADGVTSTINGPDGPYTISSRWLLAADGAGSRVRKATGIEPIGPDRLQCFIMIHFEANLRSLVKDRPGILFWTVDPDALGTFVAHDIDSTWVFMHPYDPDTEAVASYTDAACRAIVQRALGTDTVPFTIRTISPWTMTAQVVEHYRAGRIFLVGDSAHRFPPTGGMGLNTGVQDAHNLVWKLAAVEHGWATDALLETYSVERQPIAVNNSDVSLRNAARLMEVYQAVGAFGDAHDKQRALAALRDDPAVQRAVRDAIANQAEHFDMLGLQLGVSYPSGALAGTPTLPVPAHDPVREFVPIADVGHRLPHAWVTRDGARCSTLDLLELDHCTLLTTAAGREAWRAAAAGVERVPLRCLVIGQDFVDTDGSFTERLALGRDGALLIRPDQHIAWRTTDAAAAPARLRSAIATILEGLPA